MNSADYKWLRERILNERVDEERYQQLRQENPGCNWDWHMLLTLTCMQDGEAAQQLCISLSDVDRGTGEATLTDIVDLNNWSLSFTTEQLAQVADLLVLYSMGYLRNELGEKPRLADLLSFIEENPHSLTALKALALQSVGDDTILTMLKSIHQDTPHLEEVESATKHSASSIDKRSLSS